MVVPVSVSPVVFDPCIAVGVDNLEPRGEVSGDTVVFYGKDGFAFEEPGRHTVDVVVLWDVIGAIELRPLLTHVFPLHRATEAFELIRNNPGRTVLLPCNPDATDDVY